jgi:hypothetical protein
MAIAKFKINTVDYTDCVAQGGLGWAREDLHKEGSGRSLDGQMHVHRIAQKRVLKIQCRRLTDARAQQLAAALNPVTISVTYRDMQSGEVTKTFYGTELSGGTWGELGGVLYWDNISFQITEV